MEAWLHPACLFALPSLRAMQPSDRCSCQGCGKPPSPLAGWWSGREKEVEIGAAWESQLGSEHMQANAGAGYPRPQMWSE